jgi:hypothetical protein
MTETVKSFQDDFEWALQTVVNEFVAGSGRDAVCVYCEMQKIHIDDRCPCKKAEQIAKKWGMEIVSLSDYQKE